MSRHAITIRPGGAEDVPIVLALLDEAVIWLADRGQGGQWGTEPFSAREQAPGRIRSTVLAGETRIAERARQAVGALVTGDRPVYVRGGSRPELYIKLLVSSRRHAGERIGSRLIESAIELARARNLSGIGVDCWAEAPGLVAWYERQGFRRDGTFELRGWSGQVFAMDLS